MLETLKNLDQQLFFFINGLNNRFWDFVMFWLSDKLIWIPLYVLFLYLLIRYYKRQTLTIMIFVAVLMFISDQTSVHLFKNMVQRLRPCHDPAIMHLVHTVRDKCGGQFSFVSSHATNHFAISVFLIPFFGKKLKYFTPLILLWAAAISYSRVYLGVHYPGDVLAGAVWGSMVGWIMARLCSYLIAIRPSFKP